MEQVKNEGLWLEFGVYQGRDIRKIGSFAPGEVYGFDSFQGLPEDWTHFQKKGRFDVGGKPPVDVPDNVHFVKGWFEETLPRFKQEHLGPIAFLHIDSDLYSSAKFVLSSLGDRLVKDSVILFDDFLNYPGWRQGESKAFFEFTNDHSREFEFIGFASSHHSVAVRLTD